MSLSDTQNYTSHKRHLITNFEQGYISLQLNSTIYFFRVTLKMSFVRNQYFNKVMCGRLCLQFINMEFCQ